MNDEQNKLFKEFYSEMAKRCSECTPKCFVYLLTTYINENGYDFFICQLGNNSLPEEIKLAFKKFISKIDVSSIKPGVNFIAIPWCNSPYRPN